VLGRSAITAQLRNLAVRWTPGWLHERKLRKFFDAEVKGTSHAR